MEREIQQFVASLQLRTAAQHRRAAQLLHALARTLERRAAALERNGEPVGGRDERYRGQGIKPGRAFIVKIVAGRLYADRCLILFGRGLWYESRQRLMDNEAANAAILATQRMRLGWHTQGDFWLEPCSDGDGYAINIGDGMPRFYVGPQFRDVVPPAGHHRAWVDTHGWIRVAR